MTEPCKGLYSGTFNIFVRYWHAYGGWTTLWKSFYLHAALVITLIMSAIWFNPGWWDISLSILPSLVGFTLGGYAMLLSFGGERFQNLLIKAKIKDVSVFGEVSATFTHFIIVQFAGIFCALIAKGTWVIPPKFLAHILDRLEPITDWLRAGFWFFGLFLLIYALTTGVAATMRIFRLSENFVMAQPNGESDTPKAPKPPENPPSH